MGCRRGPGSTTMRAMDKDTLLREISMLLGYEVCRDLPAAVTAAVSPVIVLAAEPCRRSRTGVDARFRSRLKRTIGARSVIRTSRGSKLGMPSGKLSGICAASNQVTLFALANSWPSPTNRQ